MLLLLLLVLLLYGWWGALATTRMVSVVVTRCIQLPPIPVPFAWGFIVALVLVAPLVPPPTVAAPGINGDDGGGGAPLISVEVKCAPVWCTAFKPGTVIS